VCRMADLTAPRIDKGSLRKLIVIKAKSPPQQRDTVKRRYTLPLGVWDVTPTWKSRAHNGENSLAGWSRDSSLGVTLRGCCASGRLVAMVGQHGAGGALFPQGTTAWNGPGTGDLNRIRMYQGTPGSNAVC